MYELVKITFLRAHIARKPPADEISLDSGSMWPRHAHMLLKRWAVTKSGQQHGSEAQSPYRLLCTYFLFFFYYYWEHVFVKGSVVSSALRIMKSRHEAELKRFEVKKELITGFRNAGSSDYCCVVKMCRWQTSCDAVTRLIWRCINSTYILDKNKFREN